MAAVTGNKIAVGLLTAIVLALFLWILFLQRPEEGRVPNAVLSGFHKEAVVGIEVNKVSLIRGEAGGFKSADGRPVNQGAVREYLSALEILSYQKTEDGGSLGEGVAEIDGVVTIFRRETEPLQIRLRRRDGATENAVNSPDALRGWLEVDGEKQFWVDAYQAEDLLDTSTFFSEEQLPLK